MIKKQVFECLEKVLNKPCLNVDITTSLEQLEIDSIAFIQFIVELEDIFNIEFDDEMLTKNALGNLGDIISYIEKRKEG